MVLLVAVSSLVWSSVDVRSCNCLGFVLPNFLWHLGSVSALAAVALFCGWLQGVLGLYPVEVSLEPAPAHGHDHAHGHH